VKVEVECFTCLVHRGYLQIIEANSDPHVQFAAASALLECMAKEFNANAVSAVLGTMRDRLIKRVSGNPDVYAKRKAASNRAALEALPTLRKMIERITSPRKRFRKVCLASIVGNTIEFDIPDHDVDLNELTRLIEEAEEDLAIDHIDAIYDAAKNAEQILFLTDNAGEIAFDTLLVDELKKLGARVTVAVKGGPILNDATLDDAKTVNMFGVADEVITTGADAVGLPSPEEASEEFRRAFETADLIVAKGMGYAETLTEINLKTLHAFLLRTKCNPVAHHFGVPRNKNVAKLVQAVAESG
jgi:uncharacterized protein with ATP-grasp and redox domains